MAEAARAWSSSGTSGSFPAATHAWRGAPPTFGVSSSSIASNPWSKIAFRHESSSSSKTLNTSMPTTVAQRAQMGLSSAAAANSTAGAKAVAAGIAASSPSAPFVNAGRGLIRSTLDQLRVYHDLSKFKLSVFVVSTAATGYALGSGDNIDFKEISIVSLGTFLCSASANTFNQIFETANDGKMARTMRRPLPTGRCSRLHAGFFGIACGVAGVALLYEQCNYLTGSLGAFNIGLYALAYTPMKQVHWINTWVGAVVGAIPPLMGWAAARDAIEPPGLILASALYFWQMPHFMALAFMAKDDYVRGGYRMMSHPVFDGTGRRVAGVALRNAVAMLPIGVISVACGLATVPFAYEAGLLALPMALSSAVFYRRPNITNARRVFYGSLLYLPAFQLLACVHRLPVPGDETNDAYDEFAKNNSKQTLFDSFIQFKLPSNPLKWTAWSARGWEAWGDEGVGGEGGRLVRAGGYEKLGTQSAPPGGLRALGESMHATSHAPFPFLPPPTWPDSPRPGR